LAQAELAAAEAAAELEDRKIALEQQKRRREEAGNKQPRTSSQQSAEDVFRAQAEQILQHGATGRFIPIAEEMRQKLIDERGGEENLTDADREHIELMFEHARRKEESKS